MSMAYTHEIGRHRVELSLPEGIGPATPYSLLLAENIPDLHGLTVVDVGTGSGIQAIVALLQGAARAYVLDVDAAAIAATLANAARNGVAAGIAPLVAGGPMLPLPPGVLVGRDHLQPGAIAHAGGGPRPAARSSMPAPMVAR